MKPLLKLLKEVGMAVSDGTTLEIEVRGRNLAEGVPRAITVTSDEITQAISDPLQSIVSAVKSALEQTPPELSSDIAERGIVLTGGGALLRNLDSYWLKKLVYQLLLLKILLLA